MNAWYAGKEKIHWKLFKNWKTLCSFRLYILVKETTFLTTNLDYCNAILYGLPTSSEWKSAKHNIHQEVWILNTQLNGLTLVACRLPYYLWNLSYRYITLSMVFHQIIYPICSVFVVQCSSYSLRSCVVASWLVHSTPEWAVQVRALARDIVLCSWVRHFTLTVSLSTQVYKWAPAHLMLG